MTEGSVLSRQMPLQVHAVMQEPQNVNHLALLSADGSEHDEMPPLASFAGNMKGVNSGADIISSPDAGNRWPEREVTQRV